MKSPHSLYGGPKGEMMSSRLQLPLQLQLQPSSNSSSSSSAASCLTPLWDKACRRSSSPFSLGTLDDELTAALSEDFSESSSSSSSSSSLSLDDYHFFALASSSSSSSSSATSSPAPSPIVSSPSSSSSVASPPSSTWEDGVATTTTTTTTSTTSTSTTTMDDSTRDLILKLLGDILQDPRRTIVQRSLELLSKLCFHHHNAHIHRVFLLQAGGVVAVLQCFRRFDHVALHTAASQTLLNLVQLPQARSMVASTGGIPLLLQSLRKHRKTSFLHLCGCGVWAELACDLSSAKVLVEHGAPHAIVDSMQAFSKNQRLQESACLALYRLTAVGMPLQAVAVPGSVSAIAHALETHATIPSVRQAAHLALVALMPHPTTAARDAEERRTLAVALPPPLTTSPVSPPWSSSSHHHRPHPPHKRRPG